MFSEVAIRFNNTADDNLNYTGSVNSVSVVREYGYYVTQSASYAGEYDIETFNTDFLWLNKAHRVPGIAESLGAPVITYDIIDSTSEDMATIKVGAKLRPAIDPWSALQFEFVEGVYDGWIQTDGISIYNVGYIYDLIIDVSINDIPLISDTADTLLGRMGITINPLAAEPIWWESWVLIAVGIGVFFLAMNQFKSRGG